MDAPLARFPAPPDELDDEGFDLANLLPEDTGLPMVVWISDGTGLRHDLRVKVSQTHGDRIRRDDFAVMAVRPEPRLLHGELSRRDVEAVRAWILLNEAVILDFWDGKLATRVMLDRIKRV